MKPKMLTLLSKNGLTQVELAKRIGISRSALHRKIHGEKDYTSSEIRSIASLFNLTANEIVDLFFTEEVS